MAANRFKGILFHMIMLNIPLFYSGSGFAQCTPVSCLDTLPVWGGICPKTYIQGRVNRPYTDFASFHITSACLDAGMLDSLFKGVGAKILKLHSFKVSGLPAGMTSVSNHSEYVAPANGCAGMSGIPVEAGWFKVNLQMLINVRTWPLSSTCSGIVTLDLNNQPFNGDFKLLILPDAGFSGPASACCIQDPPVTLTITGTPGGTFSGPGVTGNSFSPSLAGPGKHQIKYSVTAQQGAATSPATADSVFTVTVRDCSVSATHEIQNEFFRLYPNPSSDRIILETSPQMKNAVVNVYSIQGILMLTIQISQTRTEIETGDFAPGMYLVVMTDQNNSVVKRFVKE